MDDTNTLMNTAVLFSGGKDSTLALSYAMESTDVKCLIILQSENPESYMFHTPNIQWATMQADAMGIPALVQKTKGNKEEELKDLKAAIKTAIKNYKIQGIVTGAVESIYQASRIQKICNDLKIESFNPLWQKDQIELLEELLKKKFEVIIVGVFAYGLDNHIGKKIDKQFIEDMKKLREKYQIAPAGEGGEYESFVLHAPFWKKNLEIKKSHVENRGNGSKVLVIEELS